MLAAHVDAQGAGIALPGRAHLVTEVCALVVEVDEARSAHELCERALEKQLHILVDQHIHQLPVPLRKPAWVSPDLLENHHLHIQNI